MSLFVYISKQCKEDIKAHDYERPIQRFIHRLHQTQSTHIFERFPASYLKKRFESQFRLVAQEVFVKEHVVVVFIRLLKRSSRDYREFLNSKVINQNHDLETLLEELPDWVAHQAEYSTFHKFPPTEEEIAILYDPLSYGQHTTYSDYHICETQYWVEETKKNKFNHRLESLLNLVFETLDSHNNILRSKNDSELGIIFARHAKSKRVVLFCPFYGEPPLDIVKQKYDKILSTEPQDEELVLKFAKRAYPHALLLDPDSWYHIEKDLSGNMALSLEEISVLQSARREKGGFPLFINGRAGSGKSTILQYLFAEYIWHHMRYEFSSFEPAYFACNQELLTSAKNSIRALLLSRSAQEDKEAFQTRLEPLMKLCFRDFYAWLYSLLDDPSKFPTDKHIDYGKFKLWWEKTFSADSSARKLYNVDLSWHIIRSYIKGINYDGYLEPEDYEEIPNKRRSVTIDTYKIVYDIVWKKYVLIQQEGFWDYQDLARYILDNNLVNSSHSAVFCDEAQDFTPIELEIIHRSSLYSKRTLDSHLLPQVPFAFAGDPFQTLNPTGFKWEATKAYFSEKFIESSNTAERPDLNYQELNYNYRSGEQIVRFCNSLQLLRNTIFEMNQIRPQLSWGFEDVSPSVFYFYRSDTEILNILKQQTEIRIIVPCEEGEEAQWAYENGLAEFVEFDEEGHVPKNVVSPIRVKGLEFTRVVLFGFGAACRENLKQAINNTEILTGDNSIEPQYYLNRLYVAASRARKRLFIIDDIEDINSFWKPIFAEDIEEERILRTHEKVGQWENACGNIIQGNKEIWQEDKEDSFEIAKMLQQNGLLQKDPFLLRQAAQSYTKAAAQSSLNNDEISNRSQMAKACRVEAYRLEDKHVKAAELLKENGDLFDAIKTAWQDRSRPKAYNFIIRLGTAHPNHKKWIYYKFASFLQSAPHVPLSDGAKLLKDLTADLRNDTLLQEVLISPIWQEVITSSIRLILEKNPSGGGLWNIVYSCCIDLLNKEIHIDEKLIGEVAYRADKLRKAHEHWSKVEPALRANFEAKYIRAKCAATPYPESIDVFAELFNHKEDEQFAAHQIIQLVEQEGLQALSSLQRAILAKSYTLLDKLDLALSQVSYISELPLLFQLADKLNAIKSEDIELIVQRIVQILTQKPRFDDLIAFLDRTEIEQPFIDSKQLKRWRNKNEELFSSFIVSAIAQSNIQFVRSEEDTRSKLDYISDWVTQKFNTSFDWCHLVHPILIGLVLERVSVFKTAQSYYETLQARQEFSEETKILAQERWIKVTIDFGLWYQRQAYIDKGEQMINLAQLKATQLNISVLDILDPAIKQLPPIFEVTEDIVLDVPRTYTQSMALKNFLVKVSPNGTRVNIEDRDSLEVITIAIEEKKVMNDGQQITANEVGVVQIPQKGLSIDLSQLTEGLLLLNTDLNEKAELYVKASKRAKLS